MKDYYKILEVSDNSSPDEIKKVTEIYPKNTIQMLIQMGLKNSKKLRKHMKLLVTLRKKHHMIV